MINWIKTGKTVDGDNTTIVYAGEGTDLRIESRKRLIPHAGGRPGGWLHTSYFVIRDGAELAEQYSLKDAKEYAEKVRKI